MQDYLKDFLVSKEEAEVTARVCESEDYEDKFITMIVEGIVEGEAKIMNEVFLSGADILNIYAHKFQANIEVSWFENTSFPFINCIDIWEVNV